MLSFHERISGWEYLLALLLGFPAFLAFAPFEFRLLLWLSLALFFWLNLRAMPSRQRMRLAWCYGIGLFAGGVHWIYVSIHFFGGANSLIAAVMVCLFVLMVALTLMLFGWLVALFPYQLRSVRLLLVFPAAWTLTEWFRSWFLTGFPWLLVGNAQIDSPLASMAPVLGVLGVGWFMATACDALVLLVLGRLRERLLALGALVLVAGFSFGLGQVTWVRPAGEPLRVAMVQGNIAQQDKWVPEYRTAHIQKYIDLMQPYIMNSDLVIWPETAVPGYYHELNDELFSPLQALFARTGSDLLTGVFYVDPDTRGVYNAMLKVGAEMDVYGKRHLVPFSEYIPLLKYLRWMERFVILPYDNVTPWTGGTVMELAGQPMRLSVCYEDAYGSEMTDGLPEATMLVNVSNDGWFSGSIQPRQHAEIARMRALEAGRYLLRATNNGVSAVIDPRGQVVATVPQYQEAVLQAEARPMQGITPFVRWGNWLLIPLLFLLLSVIWWQGRGKFR